MGELNIEVEGKREFKLPKGGTIIKKSSTISGFTLGQFGLAGGDAVLVKGSNSVGLGRLVAHYTEDARTGG